MKKLYAILIVVGTFLLVYLLQTNLFAYLTIRGVKPNLYIIYISCIGLFMGKRKGAIAGMIIGFFLDIMIGQVVGVTSILLGIVGLATEYIDEHYSKDNLLAFVVIICIMTFAYESGYYLVKMVMSEFTFELTPFLKITLLETLYNGLLTIIFYPLIKKAGYYVQNVYKRKKLLTRYF